MQKTKANYPSSNSKSQMTHAAWDAADAMDYNELEEFEVAERLKLEFNEENEPETEN